MKLKAVHLLVPILAAVLYEWIHVQPKIQWKPAEPQRFNPCPSDKTEQVLIFGATSMLGKYIVESYRKNPSICLLSYSRSACPRCHVHIKGDLRDIRHVERVFDQFNVKTVLTAVKPPLLGIHYREYVELNLLSMLELVKLSKAKGVEHFIYVSSIAAASHYIPHNMSNEDEPKPLYTEYEAPYDISKRIAEDAVLAAHEDGVFHAVSIRTAGIFGGAGDPYDFYMSLPFLVSFDVPVVVDANYAANIGDALYVVDRTMKKRPEVGGQFYYYTGEHNPESRIAEMASEVTGKPVFTIPYWMLEKFISWWMWLRFDHNVYSYADLLKMAIIPQTFDNTKFNKTFTDFKPRFTMMDAMKELYGKN